VLFTDPRYAAVRPKVLAVLYDKEFSVLFFRIISFFLLPLRLVKKGVIWLIRKYESITALFV